MLETKELFMVLIHFTIFFLKGTENIFVGHDVKFNIFKKVISYKFVRKYLVFEMKEEISVPAIIYGMPHSSLFPMHTELTYKGLHHLTPSLLLSYNCKSNEVGSLKRMP